MAGFVSRVVVQHRMNMQLCRGCPVESARKLVNSVLRCREPFTLPVAGSSAANGVVVRART